jgi:hypothetical protein
MYTVSVALGGEMCIHTSIADQDVDVLCLLLDYFCSSVDIFNITEIALDEDDSIIVLRKLNSLPDSPFVIGDVELLLAPSDDKNLFNSVEKQLCRDFCIE